MTSVTPRTLSVLALLALVPGVLFLLGRSATSVVLSLACVVVIAASLYAMFGPVGEADAGEEERAAH